MLGSQGQTPRRNANRAGRAGLCHSGTGTMPDPTQTGNLLSSLLALSFHYLSGISSIEARFFSIHPSGGYYWKQQQQQQKLQLFKNQHLLRFVCFLEFLFSQFRCSQRPTANSRKVQPTNSISEEQSRKLNTSSVSNHTPKNPPTKSQGETGVVLVITLFICLFLGTSTNFPQK